MRALQNPPPLSKKKVTYSDTETFWLQLPHILYRAFDQLFGTVTHSAGNVSFYFIGSDVSRQGRSKTREKSASAEHKYSASAYRYDPAHKWMHLCAFSHMHTQIQYPCWAGEGGDVEESQGWLIDLGMVLIVSMMEGTTPVRVCLRACVRACTRLPSFIDHVPGASVNAQVFSSARGRQRPKSLHEKVPLARDLRV